MLRLGKVHSELLAVMPRTVKRMSPLFFSSFTHAAVYSTMTVA